MGVAVAVDAGRRSHGQSTQTTSEEWVEGAIERPTRPAEDLCARSYPGRSGAIRPGGRGTRCKHRLDERSARPWDVVCERGLRRSWLTSEPEYNWENRTGTGNSVSCSSGRRNHGTDGGRTWDSRWSRSISWEHHPKVPFAPLFVNF